MLGSVAFIAWGCAPAIAGNDSISLRRYLEYEQREPCQHYKRPPVGFVLKGCDLVRVSRQVQEEEKTIVETTKQETVTSLNEVLIAYQVNFALDSSRLEQAGLEVLNNVARDIKRYNPSEVLIAGHTDRSGSDDYNMALSRRRSEAVAAALNDRGITTRIFDERAYGESAPAIVTPDGVVQAENRRVVINFMK